MKKILFLVIFNVSFSGFAQEVYEYNQTTQDMGRGGVHIPRDSDAGVLLYNPAMLAFNKGVHWSFFNLGAGFNGATITPPGSSSYNLITTSPPSSTTIAQYYGTNIWTGARGYTALSFPNFGFSYFGNTYLDFLISNPASPQFNIDSITDYGLVVGMGFLIQPDLAIGLNLKRISRTGGSTVLGASFLTSLSLAAMQSAVSATGTGYGGDLGIVWKPQASLNPLVSLCWREVGYTNFYPPTAGAVGPPILPDNLVLGVTTSGGTSLLGWSAGFEYRHIRNVDIDISKKIHIGGELNLGLVDLRGGWYQGWPSYGLTVDAWIFNVDAAYYSVERGVYSGQMGDSRFDVGINFEAGFDADFHITDMGGKKRRLKQRR